MYSQNGNDFLSLKFYWFGWKWGFAIMEIRDSRGEHKIRLSKCQKLDNFPETEMFSWVEVDESEMENLKQSGGHINFKSRDNLLACFEKLLEVFEN